MRPTEKGVKMKVSNAEYKHDTFEIVPLPNNEVRMLFTLETHPDSFWSLEWPVSVLVGDINRAMKDNSDVVLLMFDVETGDFDNITLFLTKEDALKVLKELESYKHRHVYYAEYSGGTYGSRDDYSVMVDFQGVPALALIPFNETVLYVHGRENAEKVAAMLNETRALPY